MVRAWDILKEGIPKVLEEIHTVENNLQNCGTIVDFGYLLNGVMRDLNLTEKERYIIAKIFWETQKKGEGGEGGRQ